MDDLLKKLNENNPHLAELLRGEYFKAIDEMKLQFQAEFQKSHDIIVELQSNLKKITDEKAEMNGKIDSLIAEVAKSNEIIAEFTKSDGFINNAKRSRKDLKNKSKVVSGTDESASGSGNVNFVQNEILNSSKINDVSLHGIIQHNLNLQSAQLPIESKVVDDSHEMDENESDMVNDESEWKTVEKRAKRNKNVQPLMIELKAGQACALREILIKTCGSNFYTIQQYGRESQTKILPDNDDIRNKLMDALKNNGIGFSSYNNSAEKKGASF